MTSIMATPPRPLYLPASKELRVAIDGLALRLHAPRRAAQWMPLDRISRVLSATDVAWDTPALVACLRAGVPVVFIDGHGNAQGFCHGPRRRETSLANLLIELIERPDWDERYGNWMTAIHSQLIRRQLLHLGQRVGFRDQAAARSTLCNAHYLRMGVSVVDVLRHIQGVVHGMVVQHMQDAIPSPRFLGYPRPGLSLVSDFAALMQWPAYRLLSQIKSADLADPDDVPRLAAYLAEQHRDRLTDTLDELVARFEIWLRDWEQEIIQ